MNVGNIRTLRCHQRRYFFVCRPAENGLMQQAQFSASEFSLLSEAKGKSDNLVLLENIAMRAMKGEFQDNEGKFSVRGDPDPAMAQRILEV